MEHAIFVVIIDYYPPGDILLYVLSTFHPQFLVYLQLGSTVLFYCRSDVSIVSIFCKAIACACLAIPICKMLCEHAS